MMLKHVKRRNFSGYVKKLIWADMKTHENNTIDCKSNLPLQDQEKKPPSGTPISKEKLSVSKRIEQMKQQTKKPSASLSPQPFIPSTNKNINQ
ncbi:hypothetical protein CN326_20730 [Bacillus sp. AFS018417]|nr:hypothetical protein CN326_20730 [Bacillus sp. AFS018417]